MKYYPFNIGDYRKDTQGLMPIEHYIYRTLLDECYLTELPLNPDIRELMRDLRLANDQKDDLLYVLDKFFELTEDGYINHRVNAVLSETYEKSDKARAAVNARWDKYRRKKKTYERNTDVKQTKNERYTTQYPIPNTQDSITNRNTSSAAKSGGNGRMKRPTTAEVQTYLDKLGEKRFTGQQFCDSNDAKGWVVGRNKTPMKDWKAVVRTWRSYRDQENHTESDFGQGAI